MSDIPARHCASILIVDDEPAVLALVVAILRRAGYDVLSAKTAGEAREQANTEKVHIGLLVLNHSLDAHPGSDLVATILLRHPELKVLRFSGHMESELRAKGEIAPESFFIQKPFLPKQLTAKVGQIIGQADMPLAVASGSPR